MEQSSLRSILYGNKLQDLLSYSCRQALVMLKAYLQALAKCGLSMVSSMSLSEQAQAGTLLKSMSMNSQCTEHYQCAVPDAAKNLKAEAAEALIAVCNVKGLCLDCIRKEISRDDSIVCRMGHTALPGRAEANTATSG